MRACGDIIYGIPLNPAEGPAAFKSAALERLIGSNKSGFHSPHCALDAPDPAAFGILLLSTESVDEFEGAWKHHGAIDNMDVAADSEHALNFKALWDALTPAIQSEISKFGAPRVITLWSSA